jgi:hypothetical protein
MAVAAINASGNLIRRARRNSMAEIFNFGRNTYAGKLL